MFQDFWQTLYVRVQESRKDKSNYPYWTGSAICTFKDCQVQISMAIQNDADEFMTVRYSDNPVHYGTELKSRWIRGEARKALASKFVENPGLKPSVEYSANLGKLEETQYASGNRTGLGISANAFRIISSRAKKGHRTLAGLEDTIKDVRRKIRSRDVEMAIISKRLHERNFFGFIQEVSVTEDVIRIFMAEEDTTRLYHNIASSTLFYVDATGNLFDRIQNSGRVLYYAMVVGHPFGLSTPLPVAELIANEHDTETIRRLFHELRCCERKIFKRSAHATPLGIMTDFSLAIITAALQEYNAETYHHYLERTFLIMTGKALARDLTKLYVFTCTAHIMKNVKRHAKTPAT